MDDYKCIANLVYTVRASFKTIQKQKAKQTPKIRRQKYVIKDFLKNQQWTYYIIISMFKRNHQNKQTEQKTKHANAIGEVHTLIPALGKQRQADLWV